MAEAVPQSGRCSGTCCITTTRIFPLQLNEVISSELRITKDTRYRGRRGRVTGTAASQSGGSVLDWRNLLFSSVNCLLSCSGVSVSYHGWDISWLLSANYCDWEVSWFYPVLFAEFFPSVIYPDWETSLVPCQLSWLGDSLVFFNYCNP
jgi:hypothetical protein